LEDHLSIALAGAFYFVTYLLFYKAAKIEPHKDTAQFMSCDFIVTNTLLLISLTVAQNEDVVEQFLKENITAGRILMLKFVPI
jgi:hypothetical protein